MYEPQTLIIQSCEQIDDGIGGVLTEWRDSMTLKGYLDLVTGTDQNLSVHKAFVETSTHVAIIPSAVSGIESAMRIVDSKRRAYVIDYVDDVMGVGHHLEIYCRYDGVVS